MQFVAPHSHSPKRNRETEKRKNNERNTTKEHKASHIGTITFKCDLYKICKRKTIAGYFQMAWQHFYFSHARVIAGCCSNNRSRNQIRIPISISNPNRNPPMRNSHRHSNTFWTRGSKGSSGACSESHAKGTEFDRGRPKGLTTITLRGSIVCFESNWRRNSSRSKNTLRNLIRKKDNYFVNSYYVQHRKLQ